MLFISLLFASLLLVTPPLILGVWVILLARLGPVRLVLEQIKIVASYGKEPNLKNRTWIILTVGVFSVFVLLFLGLIPLFAQTIREMEASILSKRGHSSIILSFLYSPVMPLLILEAWFGLISYFGSYYGLHQFNFPGPQGEQIGNFAITTIQLMGILSGLIGFAWWSYIGITDQNSFDSFNNFSLVELSPITVLLTFGLVIMLFISLSKISILEENTEQSKQVAKRITAMLIASLVIFSTIGGLLSILIHLDRNPF